MPSSNSNPPSKKYCSPFDVAMLVFSAPPQNLPFSTPIASTSRRLLSLAFNPPSSSQGATIPVSASPFSLRIEQVRGDGRCLYRAIAKGLASAEGRRLSESLERADADALRDMAYKAMCVDRFKEFNARRVVEGNLSAYCRQMRAPTFYAGEAEMLALADVLKMPIRVYLMSRGELRNIATYGEKYRKRTKAGMDADIRVLYNGANHYDSIKMGGR